MSYIGTSINESPVIAKQAGVKILDGAFLAVALNTEGNVTLATAGVNALGVLPAETPETVDKDGTLTIQIKDIGLWKAGGVINAGAEITSNADGKAVVAVSGNFITAIALEAAEAADQVIRVQICKAGYKA